MQTEMLKLIEDFEVVSFDVFDTLLLRPYLRPSDMFLQMEIAYSAPGFAKSRMWAEQKAYSDLGSLGLKERTLHEIYSYIPGFSSFESQESEFEKKVLKANPEIVHIYDEAKKLGKSVVITSDMYLPREVLCDILQVNGVNGWSAFYLSCEAGAQKKTGELYAKVIADFTKNGHAPRVLHIGDNWDSDVVMAQRAGVTAAYYPRVAERFLAAHPFVENYFQKGDRVRRELTAGVLALGWHLFACAHSDVNYWHELGFLHAGMLGSMYLGWILDQCKANGIQELMFLGRDGYVLQKMLNVVDPAMKSRYFYSSRVTALLATARDGTENWSTFERRKTVLELLKEKKDILLDEDEALRYVHDGELPQRAQSALDDLAAYSVSEYARYLGGFDMDPSRTAIVDGCSLNGSGQRLAEIALKRDITTFYLLLMGKVKNGAAVYNCPVELTRFIDICEFMFGAPTPPVVEIVGRVPVYRENIGWAEQYKMDACPAICVGAVAAARIFAENSILVQPEDWLDWCDAFMDNLTGRDRFWLSRACNAGDVAQTSFKSVVRKNPAGIYKRNVAHLPLLKVKRYRVGCEWRWDYLFLGRWKIWRRVISI